jgi:hypothetical protein
MSSTEAIDELQCSVSSTDTVHLHGPPFVDRNRALCGYQAFSRAVNTNIRAFELMEDYHLCDHCRTIANARAWNALLSLYERADEYAHTHDIDTEDT